MNIEITMISQSMKNNPPTEQEKQDIHLFLSGLIKVNNLNVISTRESLDMARISEKLMLNDFFKDYFVSCEGETTARRFL